MRRWRLAVLLFSLAAITLGVFMLMLGENKPPQFLPATFRFPTKESLAPPP